MLSDHLDGSYEFQIVGAEVSIVVSLFSMCFRLHHFVWQEFGGMDITLKSSYKLNEFRLEKRASRS